MKMDRKNRDRFIYLSFAENRSVPVLPYSNQAIEAHNSEIVTYTVQRAAAKAKNNTGGHNRRALEALVEGRDWYASERTKSQFRFQFFPIDSQYNCIYNVAI
jgi:hypothetical protein